MESDLDRVSADPRPEPLLLLLPPVSSPSPCRRCSCIPDITYSVVDSRPPVPWRAAGSMGISGRVCHCSCRELRDRYRGSFFFQSFIFNGVYPHNPNPSRRVSPTLSLNPLLPFLSFYIPACRMAFIPLAY